jgi:hypothetical protein
MCVTKAVTNTLENLTCTTFAPVENSQGCHIHTWVYFEKNVFFET